METKLKIIEGREFTLYENGRTYRHEFTDGIGRVIKGRFLKIHVSKGRRYASSRVNGRDQNFIPSRVVAEVCLSEWDESLCVDHINGDPLDDRPCNLRMVTHGQNIRGYNKPRKGVSSKYRGVSWNVTHGKWIAQCRINGKVTHLGCFDSEIEAASVRDKIASENGYMPEALNQINESK